jgi:hypothetical protein
VAEWVAAARNSPPRKPFTPKGLYDVGDHTVQQIADPLCVPRCTVYGHLDKTTIGRRPRRDESPAITP